MMMMMMMKAHPSNRERGGLRDIFPKSSGPGRWHWAEKLPIEDICQRNHNQHCDPPILININEPNKRKQRTQPILKLTSIKVSSLAGFGCGRGILTVIGLNSIIISIIINNSIDDQIIVVHWQHLCFLPRGAVKLIMRRPLTCCRKNPNNYLFCRAHDLINSWHISVSFFVLDIKYGVFQLDEQEFNP